MTEIAVIVDINYMEDEREAISIFSSIYCEFRLHGYILENRYFIKKSTEDEVKSDIADIMSNLCQFHGKVNMNTFIKNISIVKKSVFKNLKSEFI